MLEFSPRLRKGRLQDILTSLRAGRRVTDVEFDQLYPAEFRKFSITHWTPVTVGLRAAQLLEPGERTRILDVGAGIGKFCAVASLISRGQFIGIELRNDLAAVARQSIRDLCLERVSIIPGNMADLDWTFFDAFYLFNPFYEDKIKFFRNIETVRTKLKHIRPGSKVVTYHGFGGVMPADFICQRKEIIGTDYLELWVKIGPA